jgi:RNA polymerase sigma-70 factor (ECF subfamily)
MFDQNRNKAREGPLTVDAGERRLVERAAGGDTRAFGELYQRHVDRVYSYVSFRVRDSDLAEDLTQDVFMQMMRALEGFDWRGSLAPWLMRIARNTVIDHWRKQGRRPERAVSLTESQGQDEEGGRLERLVDETGEDEIERAALVLDRGKLLEASAALTDLQRQVIALRFGSELSIRETAEAMDRSEGAIKNLQHHALRALRAALAEMENPEESRT